MNTDCGRCGFPVHRAARIRSRHTGLSYCADATACARRTRNDLSYEEMAVIAERALRLA